MKIYWTVLFTLFTLIGFAQTPTGDIKKDTALANRHFEKVDNSRHLKELTNENIKFLQEAIKLYEAYPFNEKLLEIKGLLSTVLIEANQLDMAQKVAQETIALAKSKVPNETYHPMLAQSYWTMNTFLYRKGDPDGKKISYGVKAMKCAEKNFHEYFNMGELLVVQYVQMGRITSADSLLSKLENILETKQDSDLDRYWILIYRGRMTYYSRRGDYDKAIIYGKKILNENKEYNIYSATRINKVYGELAYAYGRVKDFDNAIFFSQKRIETSPYSKDNPALGGQYHQLGSIYGLKRDLPLAIENYEKAIFLYLKDTISFKRHLSRTYYTLSVCHRLLKQFDEAEQHIQAGIKYNNTTRHELQYALILLEQNKYEVGFQQLQNALLQETMSFKNKDIYQNPPSYETYRDADIASLILFEKGNNWYQWGKMMNDTTKMKEGLEILKLPLKMKEDNALAMVGFDRAKIANNIYIRYIFDVMMDGKYAIQKLNPSNKIFDEFIYVTERRKAMQLIEVLSPSALPEAIFMREQSLVKKIQDYEQQLDIYTIKESKDSIVFYQNALFDVSQEMEKHYKEIEENYPKEANAFYNIEYAKLGAIQQSLSEETLFIGYNSDDEEQTSFILTIGKSNKKIVKIDITHLEEKINTLNKLIQSRLSSQKSIREKFIKTSHELYNVLIKPIEAELVGKSKLMIVVEGQLFHLPFELLLASDESKPYHELDFLIKKYEINYHYSATAFLRLKEKQTVQDKSLLAFAPIFNKGDELTETNRSLDFLVDSVYRSIEDFEFTALPNTKKEVKAISKLVKSNDGQANILLSKNATKNKLAQQIEQQPYQFVHIATHGLVNFKNPKLSALACYSKDETMDNLMYANEIQFKDINADLVILSSCESGIGQFVQGEGLIALNRSFIYSGAKNVIFSLWKVSDKYSSELMIDFYKNYFDNTENPSYTSALRQAKLKMLEDPISAQPKFWSAFVLMGE